jgi:hypothetical protein
MGGTTYGHGALVAAILLGVGATSSYAAPNQLTQDRCTQYARRAIAQYQAMTGHASCRIADSPRWQNNFDNHYNACLLVPESLTKGEEAARDSYLQSCGGIDAASLQNPPALAPTPQQNSNGPSRDTAASVSASTSTAAPTMSRSPDTSTPPANSSSASTTVSPQPGQKPVSDPRLPYPSGRTVGLQWTYMGGCAPWLRPRVWFLGQHIAPNDANADGIYLGYDERGSWILNRYDGKVYLWNGTTVGPDAIRRDDVPKAVLTNTSSTVRRLARDGQLARRPSNEAQDPNMPPPYGSARGVDWVYIADSTVPLISVMGVDEDYLGFNDRGSWYANRNGTIYVFQPAGSTFVTEVASKLQDVPKDVLGTLRNSTVAYPSPTMPSKRSCQS